MVLYTPLLSGPHCLEDINVRASVSTSGPEIEVALLFLSPDEPPVMGEAGGASPEAWHTIDIALSGENGCLSPDLLLGIFVHGEGEAWVDGVRLTAIAAGAEQAGIAVG